MKTPLLVGALTLGVLGLAQGSAHADIYRYVDRSGSVHFTNLPIHANAKKVVVEPRLGGPGRLTAEYGKSTGIWYYRYGTRRGTNEFDGLILAAAKRHNLEPNLVKAVIHVESFFNPAARSPKGAQGLMQLMPGTARLVGVRNAWNPEENIDGGAQYLRMMMDRFHNVTHALAAYNAGPENVAKAGGVPSIPETVDYVRRVKHYARLYDGNVGAKLLAKN